MRPICSAAAREISERRRVARLFAMRRRLVREALLVAGVDEVGVGPLAGRWWPAVICTRARCGLDDSKQLAAARERLFAAITRQAVAIGVGENLAPSWIG
jgi:hypothetical protein